MWGQGVPCEGAGAATISLVAATCGDQLSSATSPRSRPAMPTFASKCGPKLFSMLRDADPNFSRPFPIFCEQQPDLRITHGGEAHALTNQKLSANGLSSASACAPSKIAGTNATLAAICDGRGKGRLNGRRAESKSFFCFLQKREGFQLPAQPHATWRGRHGDAMM